MDPTGTMVVALSASPSHPEHESRCSSNKSSTDKRRPFRRDPEKRRQQNIQAQKKYRQKVKKRVDDLEILAASITETRGANPTDSPTIEFQSSYHHMRRGINDDSIESSAASTGLTFPIPISLTSASDIAPWNSTATIIPCQLTHYNNVPSMPQYWLSHVDCGCLGPHVQVTSTGPGLKEYQLLPGLNIGPNLYSADPYINTLRVERICVVQAVLSNCSHIGITENMLCDDDAISPFFRPHGKMGDDSDSVVVTIQNIFKTLKQDVRPIREQITTKHGPMIDVLPFPTLRKNLIRNGGHVDEDELFDDLLNGLVCWGGAGVGKRDRDCATGYVSTGTPWDRRSWEARTWFLKKYWGVLGGEEGELVQQSEWWRNMRGDETDPWLRL